ncbi:hypothetical protein [Yoonia sp. 2307UL14-13]|uniref:hypothetical protein n=1 Tax=Yoonia sp. 2307UL14-13 TaxID=3126506 RepID=UPI0030983AA2
MITRIVAIGALILSGSAASADEAKSEAMTPPDFGGFETEAAQTSSLNATYIVVGVLLAFLAVNTINDSSD